MSEIEFTKCIHKGLKIVREGAVIAMPAQLISDNIAIRDMRNDLSFIEMLRINLKNAQIILIDIYYLFMN